MVTECCLYARWVDSVDLPVTVLNPHPIRWTLPIFQMKNWGAWDEVSCPTWSSQVRFKPSSWLQIPAPPSCNPSGMSAAFSLTKVFSHIVLHPPLNLWDGGAGIFIPILQMKKWNWLVWNYHALLCGTASCLGLKSVPLTTFQVLLYIQCETHSFYQSVWRIWSTESWKILRTYLAKWHQIHLT